MDPAADGAFGDGAVKPVGVVCGEDCCCSCVGVGVLLGGLPNGTGCEIVVVRGPLVGSILCLGWTLQISPSGDPPDDELPYGFNDDLARGAHPEGLKLTAGEEVPFWTALTDFPLWPESVLTFKANLLPSAVADFCAQATGLSEKPRL